MWENQTLDYITITVLTKIGQIIKQEKPDYLMVLGNTANAMAASLAVFYLKIKIAHV